MSILYATEKSHGISRFHNSIDSWRKSAGALPDAGEEGDSQGDTN